MPESLAVARMRLQLELARRADDTSRLDAIRRLKTNLREGDSLIGPLAPSHATDFAELRAFQWSHEFPEVMSRGGFDAVLSNPPWDVFKPNAKEFFAQYSELVTKKSMTIARFKVAKGRLLADPEIRAAWNPVRGPLSDGGRVVSRVGSVFASNAGGGRSSRWKRHEPLQAVHRALLALDGPGGAEDCCFRAVSIRIWGLERSGSCCSNALGSRG